ncbi:MAG: rRNA maturation RNase YbeY [Pseudomonadota bacterium]|nr:rRNA maturation RNase YbeY [Pseudomonadota bacterium]
MDSDSIPQSFTIELTCHNDDWPLPEKDMLEQIAANVLSAVKWERKCVISILFTDDSYIKDLNKTYRGKDKPTNVLSFSGYCKDFLQILPHTEDIPLGDIIFALETIRAEATQQNKPFENHLNHLFVHGLLHLLGFDHETEPEAAIMEQLEIEILSTLLIPNPYEVIESL